MVTWTRSGKQLPINRHVINGNQLTIKNTTEDDDGAYLCQGANQLGNVVRVIWVFVKVVGKLKSYNNNNDLWLNFHRDDSCNNIVFFFFFFFHLSPKVNPYIVSSPLSDIQVQNVGDTVRLNCSAGGSPLPNVTWLKDRRRIISRAVNDGNDLIKSEIVIHRFKPSDAGIYTCLFYNDKNVTVEANTSLSMSNVTYLNTSIAASIHFFSNYS